MHAFQNPYNEFKLYGLPQYAAHEKNIKKTLPTRPVTKESWISDEDEDTHKNQKRWETQEDLNELYYKKNLKKHSKRDDSRKRPNSREFIIEDSTKKQKLIHPHKDIKKSHRYHRDKDDHSKHSSKC